LNTLPEKTLKVLHVIPSVSPRRGGPSMVIRTMTRGLAERGVQVDVATTDDDGAGRFEGRPSPAVESGGTYRFFPRQVRFYLFSLPLNRWLGDHLREYDLVHIHALFSYPATVAASWARKYGLPYIVRPLGTLNRWGVENRRPWLKQLSLRMVERRILAGAAAVHFTSAQEELEARVQGAITRPVIIPNAIELSDFREAGPGWLRAAYPQLDGRRIVLFLSRLDPKKGLDLLLSAFHEVRRQHPEAALVVAGDGDRDFVSSLHRQAQQLGLGRDIVWAGFLEGKQKVTAMREADVFVLSSYSENFGVAVVEAMACGLPVIVSDQVGIHHEISASGAGLVVPCEKDRLANAILHVLGDDGLRSRLAQNGIALSQTYSVEAVMDQLIRLYRDIARCRTTH